MIKHEQYSSPHPGFDAFSAAIDAQILEARGRSDRNPDYLYITFDDYRGKMCSKIHLSREDLAHRHPSAPSTDVEVLIPPYLTGPDDLAEETYFVRPAHVAAGQKPGVLRITPGGMTVEQNGRFGVLREFVDHIGQDDSDARLYEFAMQLGTDYIPQPLKDKTRYIKETA